MEVNNLPVKVEWKTLVGSLEPQVEIEMNEVITPGFYSISIDTIDGNSIPFDYQYPLQLEVHDSYVMIGGHTVHNAYIESHKVVVSCPSFQSRVLVHNWPHDFRRR